MIVVCLMIIGALGQSAVAMETNSAANHQTHTEHHQHQSQKKAQIKSKVLDRSARIQFNKSLNLNDVHVEVNGMVCAFCAQGIQKAFEKHPSIQNVRVDLDAASVFLTIKDKSSLNDTDIKNIINNAGYHVVTINRYAMKSDEQSVKKN